MVVQWLQSRQGSQIFSEKYKLLNYTWANSQFFWWNFTYVYCGTTWQIWIDQFAISKLWSFNCFRFLYWEGPWATSHITEKVITKNWNTLFIVRENVTVSKFILSHGVEFENWHLCKKRRISLIEALLTGNSLYIKKLLNQQEKKMRYKYYIQLDWLTLLPNIDSRFVLPFV